MLLVVVCTSMYSFKKGQSQNTVFLFSGSLQDVLFNDDLKLDWMFQVSIASDIARVRSRFITIKRRSSEIIYD